MSNAFFKSKKVQITFSPLSIANFDESTVIISAAIVDEFLAHAN